MSAASKRLVLRQACAKDLPWLFRYDPHISKSMMQDKVARSEVMVALEAGRQVGLLRYSLYCDWIPFIIFLFVLEDHRRTGVGSQLATFFERQMRRSRFKLAMVSSASVGTSQHFWRKMGYHDAGCLCVPHEPFEILFAKEL